MSEMLGNPSFHRGAKTMRMKENGENKIEKFFVGFMSKLSCHLFFSTETGYWQPLTLATSSYQCLLKSRKSLEMERSPSKVHFSPAAVPAHFPSYIKVLLPH